MLKIFNVDDYEWYVACCRDRAVRLAADRCGCSIEDYEDGGYDDPLSIKELRRLRFYDDIERQDTSKSRSFLMEYIRRLLTGQLREGFFATSEY